MSTLWFYSQSLNHQSQCQNYKSQSLNIQNICQSYHGALISYPDLTWHQTMFDILRFSRMRTQTFQAGFEYWWGLLVRNELGCNKMLHLGFNGAFLDWRPLWLHASSVKNKQTHRKIILIVLNSPRTSVDMDRTLKIVNYKVGGTQNPSSFTETQYFFFFMKILSYAHKT